MEAQQDFKELLALFNAHDVAYVIRGVTWNETDENKETGTYGGVPVFYIGRPQLIKNKRLTGRQKDFADLESLAEESCAKTTWHV